jgi:hypothetical protein
MEVYRVREATFKRFAEEYLKSGEPMTEIGYTLLGEGGFLLSYPNKAAYFLPIIGEINKKFNKW